MLHISSIDIASGTKYDGTYNFGKSLLGNFSLIYQSFSNFNDIPWVYSGCNTMYIENFNNFGEFSIITFPEMIDDDETSVRSWFTTAIATSGWVTVASSSYDATTNIYSFIFSGPILIRYAVADSPIGYVFNWVYADPLPPGNPIANTLQIDGKYITKNPKILELYCPQIQSQAVTIKGNNPSIFIATQDQFAINQEITILNEVNSLDLSIYRPNNYTSPVPIKEDYELIFKPI